MKKIFIFLLLVILVFSGCINIQNINNYANSSVSSLEKFQSLPFSYTENCTDRCLMNNIDSSLIKRSDECNCRLYIKADSISNLIINYIRLYFVCIANISDKNSNNITYLPIYTSLTENTYGTTNAEGNFKGIKISHSDVGAVDTLLSAMSNTLLNIYKIKKLKLFITQSNPSLQIILTKLKVITNNLNNELSFREEVIYSHYRKLVLTNVISAFEKEKIVVDYYNQLNTIENKKAQMSLFSTSLDIIADGHQKLFENKEKLTAVSIAKSIANNAATIKSVIVSINRLQK